ncbi:MAG TPA: hypothetical protein VET66_13385 [Steroidobacteraceae bacterium]|nr:hypothetical protein [Steroidobacteraceae bacterium]
MVAATKPAARRFSLPALSTHAVGLLLVPLAAIAVALVQPVDFDYWWQRRTGAWIIAHLAPPRSDPFSFTMQGKPWVDHEWLSQVLMFGADSVFGYLGLFLLFMALGVAAWWLVYRLLRTEGLAEMPALLLSIVPAAFGATYWRARPAMFSVFFVALFIYEISAARRGERRTLWRLVPLTLLWANLHGGYVIGLVLIAMLAAAQWWERRETAGPGWKHVLAVCGVAFVAAAVNPYTYRLWLYPLEYFVGGNASLARIDEWQSPDFHQARNLPLALLLVTGLVVGVNGRRFDAWRSMLVAAFGLMALQSMRHQPLFAIAWATAAGPALLDRWAWWGRTPERRAAPKMLNYALLAAGVAALLTVVIASPTGLPLRNPPTGGAMPYPAQGAAWIAANRPGARIFNQYEWGGYLIDRLYPDERVFIDGRADLYGPLVVEYDSLITGRGWQPAFERYGVDTALLSPQLPIVAALRAAGWTTGYEDAHQVVLVRPG